MNITQMLRNILLYNFNRITAIKLKKACDILLYILINLLDWYFCYTFVAIQLYAAITVATLCHYLYVLKKSIRINSMHYFIEQLLINITCCY